MNDSFFKRPANIFGYPAKLAEGFPYGEWTTAPPKEPGIYQAIHEDEGQCFVKVVKGTGSVDMMAMMHGVDMLCGLDGFTHWIGPIPLAEPPK